jgi:hypothetical protein
MEMGCAECGWDGVSSKLLDELCDECFVKRMHQITRVGSNEKNEDLSGGCR